MSRLKLSFGSSIEAVHIGCKGAARSNLRIWSDDRLAKDLWQFFLAGLSHHQSCVRQQFQKSVQVARRAAGENANDAMITAALLCFPCHMLASRKFSPTGWNSDRLIESGTFDWLQELFGEEVAEVVRLQPHCRRYLASINREFADNLDQDQQEQLLRDGGEMSLESKFAFARLRYFSPAMQLTRWIYQSSKFPNTQLDGTKIGRAGSSLPCTGSSIN